MRSSLSKPFYLPLLGILSIYWTLGSCQGDIVEWFSIAMILRKMFLKTNHPLTIQLCGETLKSLIGYAVYHPCD